MGTNYYAHIDTCERCKRPWAVVHLGKSSGGWRFTFNLNGREHYYDVPSMKQWLKGKRIFDEYEEEVSHDDFWNLVEAKQSAELPDPNRPGYNHAGDDIDIGGYNFIDVGEFS
jgi:hypothetical protein